MYNQTAKQQNKTSAVAISPNQEKANDTKTKDTRNVGRLTVTVSKPLFLRFAERLETDEEVTMRCTYEEVTMRCTYAHVRKEGSSAKTGVDISSMPEYK